MGEAALEDSFDRIQGSFGKNSSTIQSKLSSSFVTRSQKTDDESLMVTRNQPVSPLQKNEQGRNVNLTKSSNLNRVSGYGSLGQHPMRISAEAVQSEVETVGVDMMMRQSNQNFGIFNSETVVSQLV